MTQPTVVFVASRGTYGGPNQSLLAVLGALHGKVRRVLAAPDPLISLATSRDVIEDHFSLGHRSVGGRLSRAGAAGRLALWLRRRRGAVSAIHANNLSALNIAGPGALLIKKRTVVWAHASALSAASASIGRSWSGRLDDLQWAAVSNVTVELLTESGLAAPDEITIVPNPVDPSRRAARRTEDGFTVACLGGPAPEKGYRLVAGVVQLLQEEDIRWFIVAGELATAPPGADPATTLLSALTGQNVVISDWVPAVAEVYADASVVFCPSYLESFGMVAAEAMVNGIPVVASDIPAFRELIGHEAAGLLFPPGDLHAAAAAIRRLAADPALCRRLGETGSERATALAPDAVAARLLALYGLPA